MAAVINYHLCFILLLAVSSVAVSEKCDYLLKVKTGDIANAGTDATISMRLQNKDRQYVEIPNLEDCGIMPAGYDYFERGHTDSFRCQLNCLEAPVCHLEVYSDNSGSKAGWYLSSVQLDISGATSDTQSWIVNQWLALDEPPYQLYAIKNCPQQQSIGGEIMSVADDVAMI